MKHQSRDAVRRFCDDPVIAEAIRRMGNHDWYMRLTAEQAAALREVLPLVWHRIAVLSAEETVRTDERERCARELETEAEQVGPSSMAPVLRAAANTLREKL